MGQVRQPIRLAALAMAALLAACAQYDDPYYVHSVWRPADAAAKQADVFFLTDRKPNPYWLPDKFDRVRAAPSCGIVFAGIPPARLPAGDAAFASERKDRRAIACGEGETQIADSIAQAAHAKNCNAVLVYVHGFDTGFETAVLRAGQLASDTQWPCVVAAFSWTSVGNKRAYESDLASVAAAEPLFAAFLHALSDAGLRTDIISHSMGAKLTLKALTRDGATAHNVILAAPDIGIAEFPALVREAAPRLRHLTIYASAEDVALAISRRLNGGEARIGRSPSAVRGAADVIDAGDAPAELMGHEYYGMSYEMLTDMSLALADVPADARLAAVDGRKATLERGNSGNYRLKVRWMREPDVFTRFLRWLMGLIGG